MEIIKMKKSIIIIVAIVMAVVINKNKFCYEVGHREEYPVNPYCEKCGERDGVVQHECKNPNGENKYCRVCGKIVSNK